MMGRAGSWVGTALAGSIQAKFWFYQDFVAGSGPNLTITGNDNGTGGDPFDSARIVNSSAVVTDTNGNPIYDAAAGLPTDLVKVSSHTGTAVVLNLTPDASYGAVRVWYLYTINGPGAPVDIELAPRFVKEVRSEHLDTRYLNAALNLSDITDATTARTNLGFTTHAAGRVLLADGSNAFTSDADLFFDTSNNRLGIVQGTPLYTLDVTGRARITTSIISPVIYGSIASGGTLTLNSTEHATKGQVLIGSMSQFDETNSRFSTGDLVTAQSAAITANWSGSGYAAYLRTQHASNTGGLAIARSRASAADLQANDTIGPVDFIGQFNGGAGSIASVLATYVGNGTTRRGSIALQVANDAAPANRLLLNYDGDVQLGTNYREYSTGFIRLFNTSAAAPTYRIQIKAGGAFTDTLGFESPAGQLYRIYPDDSQLSIAVNGASEGNITLTTQQRIVLGDGTPNYKFAVHKSSTETAVGSITGSDPIIAIRNLSSTANNICGLVFENQGQVWTSGIFGIHEDHASATTYAGRLEGWVSTSGARRKAFSIESSNEVRLYGTTSGYFGLLAAATTTSYTLTMPSAQGAADQVLVNNGSGTMSWAPRRGHKAGTVSLSSATTSRAITFATARADALYTVNWAFRNTVDTDPMYQPWTVIAQSNTGFTVEWNEELDSANYIGDWSISEHYDP